MAHCYGRTRARPGLVKLVALILAFAPPAVSAEDVDLVVPRHESASDTRSVYETELLKLALGKMGVVPHVRPYGRVLAQDGVVGALSQTDDGITVAWFETNAEREKALLPVRIPIDKGLIGWRIPIERADHFDQFRHARVLADLVPFVAVQGTGWPDVAVLEKNGLRVASSGGYEAAFQSLASGKVDYFPRSIIEYREELAAHRDEGLVEDSYIALRYPGASYFFVGRQNEALARLIEAGLERALRDGSFDKLFYRYFAEIIEVSGLQSRHIIELANPDFSAKDLLTRRVLWFRPSTLAASGAAPAGK